MAAHEEQDERVVLIRFASGVDRRRELVHLERCFTFTTAAS